jgi:hypothetical protein
LYILHSLIEWQLHDSQAVRSIIEYHNSNTRKNEYNPIRSYPIGIDSKKRTYWQFGGKEKKIDLFHRYILMPITESCWIWRERTQLKTGFDWETVCKNRQDLEKLVQELSASTSRAEKALVKVITENIYELADNEERKRIQKERAEIRKLIPVEINITPTTLRSGGRTERVRYNYDDYDEAIFGNEDDEDDEFEEEDQDQVEGPRKRNKAPPASKPAPTRWSSRLHGVEDGRWTDALNVDEAVEPVDKMAIDTQQQIEQESMDTTPIQSEMDTESPNISVMETSPSEIAMDVSRSQSVSSAMDISTRPQSAMDFAK